MVRIDLPDGLPREFRRAPVLALFGESGVGKSRLAAQDADAVVTVEAWRDRLVERLVRREPTLDAELLAPEVLVIDDVGCLEAKPHTIAELARLVRERAARDRRTILVEGWTDRSLELVLDAVGFGARVVVTRRS